MSNIAVLGDRASIYAYESLGMEVFETKNKQDSKDTLHNLAESGYAVIFIVEAVAEEILLEIKKYDEKLTPAIILIPGVSNNTGRGLKNLSKSVEKAVGSDILSK